VTSLRPNLLRRAGLGIESLEQVSGDPAELTQAMIVKLLDREHGFPSVEIVRMRISETATYV